MHELGITQSIVGICLENSGGVAVKSVILEIGKLSAVMPDAVRFCFDICASGTLVEGAALEIIETPGMAECQSCAVRIPVSTLFGRCVCGSSSLKVIAGEELKVRELEV